MVKRLAILLVPLIWSIASWASPQNDTISYWTIYYGKVELMQGNITQISTGVREIKIKRDVVWELCISFFKDTGGADGELEIRLEGQTLRTLKSTLENGDFFVIPTRELIDTKTKGKRYKMDFYYSDNKGIKNLNLGTIIFKT